MHCPGQPVVYPTSLLSSRFRESAPVGFTAVELPSLLFLHPAGVVLPGEPAIVL